MREAVIYSLSESGAFLQTQRACIEGAEVELDLELPAQPLRVRGRVAFANVPGNLHRDNSPDGMGVEYLDIEGDALTAIRNYVKTRRSQLEV